MAIVAEVFAHPFQPQERLPPLRAIASGTTRNRLRQVALQRDYTVEKRMLGSVLKRLARRARQCQGSAAQFEVRAVARRQQERLQRGYIPRRTECTSPRRRRTEPRDPKRLAVANYRRFPEGLRRAQFALAQRPASLAARQVQRAPQRNPYSGDVAGDFQRAA